jgi:hypothetical protein
MMSWSLRVHNGDFVLGGGKLDVVTGPNKLVQDFRHYLLEHMGSDPLHPNYGSLIDGGMLSDGTVVDSPIGQTDWNMIALKLESEIRRIAAAYQNSQLQRAKNDRIYYGRSTLTANEILAAVSAIHFTQNADALIVEIVIETGDFQLRTTNLVLDPVVTF